MTKTFQPGWYKMRDSNKLHYFYSARQSHCGHWRIYTLEDVVFEGGEKFQDKTLCTVCAKRVASMKRMHETGE